MPTGVRAPGMSGIDFDDPALEASVRDGLTVVEQRLRDVVANADPFVTEVAQHLAEAGGKRFRPLLALLAAQFGGGTTAEVIEAAVVVELTHLGTLYHDDVMDEADVRRGAPSANSRWTNTIAILTGDYLFACASDVVGGLGPDAVRVQAQTFSRLVTGQIRETAGPRDGADPVEHYLYVVAEKTGSLIATSCLFGAEFAGAGPEIVRTLTRFGEVIGVAFQLSDDLLDIASESVQSGKTPGTDLREGVRTLPVLHALRGSDPGEDRLRSLLGGALVDDALHTEALDLLRKSPAMDTARATLQSYVDEAHTLLAELPDIPARAALRSLADFVLARTG